MVTLKRGDGSLGAVLTPYAIAAMSVAVATWVRLLLDPWLLDRAQFVTLFAAVVFTAWYGGIPPALFAVACGSIAAVLFVLEPRHTFTTQPSPEQVGLLLWAIIALGCALLVESLRAARLRVEERRRRFSQAVLDTIPVHLAVLDVTGSIVAVNAAWSRFAADNGGSRRAGVGANYLEVAREARGPGSEDARRAAAGIRAVLSGASSRFTLEYPCPSPTVQRWFLLLAAPLQLDTQHCVVAHVDITDRKLAEERLRESEEELRRVDRNKSEFLATLGHELRNPLASIRNAAHVLSEKKDDRAVAQQMRDLIDRQSTYMSCLVEDLLDVSRIAQGKIELRKQQLNLVPVVRDAVEMVQPLVDAAGHALASAMPPEPVYVDADRTRVEQVIANLLTNAAKYTPAGGRIALSVDREHGDAVIRVTDNGVGIARDMLPRVFDVYSQAAQHLDRARGGLGLGLSVVKRLVEMHGGSVEAASTGPGKGSTFTVRLPLARPQYEPSPSA